MNKIYLQPVEDSDINGLHNLLNNMDSQVIVGGSVRPFSLPEVKDWLDKKRQDHNTYLFAIKDNDEFCGDVQLVDVNLINETAVLGINLLADLHSMGMGTQVLNILHDFAKNKLCLRKICVYVRGDNHKSLGLFKKFEYKPVGVLLQQIKLSNNKYIDLHILEVFL